jgi:hypothetical protein
VGRPGLRRRQLLPKIGQSLEGEDPGVGHFLGILVGSGGRDCALQDLGDVGLAD